MQTEINLSSIERRLLNAIVEGLTTEVTMDGVTFRRLIAFGYLKETDTGDVQTTVAGKRALADIKSGDGAKEDRSR